MLQPGVDHVYTDPGHGRQLGQALQESEAARTFYRSARRMDLSEEDWRKLLEHRKRRKQS